MTTARRSGWVTPCLLGAALSLLACGSAEPPLDQLDLRDALLADPAVIAGLPRALQQRLAERFLAAATRSEPEQQPALAEPSPPEQRLRRFDVQRQQRGQDAFLIGIWGQSAATQTLTPLVQPVRSAPSTPLPPLQGRPSTVTTAQETRALAGRAGAAIEDLRSYTHTAHLERVTGWPTAVLAIEDRVYVNAAWLTALAALGPEDSQSSDPATALSRAGGGVLVAYHGTGASTDELSTLTQPLEQGDSALDPTAPPSADNPASGFGSCSSCSSSSSSCNSCSSSSSSCSGSSCSNSGPDCNNSGSCASSADKQCCRACAITPAHPVPDLGALWMLLWLSTPLALLAGVDIRTRAVARRRAQG